MSRYMTLLLMALFALHSIGCSRTAGADLVLLNGQIYVGSDEEVWVEAVAVSEGQFVASGDSTTIEASIRETTTVIDLDGKMAMPGLYDSHVHPIGAAFQALFDCSVSPDMLPMAVARAVAECARDAGPGEWIRGGAWGIQHMGTVDEPHRSMLDAGVSDNPVLLRDITGHAVWVNSNALEMLRIDADSPDPPGGIIVKDQLGVPTGVLLETAGDVALDALPGRPPEQYRQALTWAVDRLNSYGVVGIKDAGTDESSLQAYTSLDNEGELTVRVAASLGWRGGSSDEAFARQEALVAGRSQYKTPRVNPDFIKILVDGIPPSRTAYFLEPYLPDEINGADYRGELLISAAQLSEDLVYLDSEGLSVMMHTAGDGAVRVALDAIESAREQNGDSGILHDLAHTSYVHPDDIGRYGELGVVAGYSPVFWFPSTQGVVDAADGLEPERRGRMFPIRDLSVAQAIGAYGTDWPVTPDPNPWPAMEAMITRAHPFEATDGTFWEAQAIDLQTAIPIFTSNGARALRLDGRAGRIAPGYSADLIVLDRNLFEIPSSEISDTRVLLTILEGEIVHDAR